MPFQPNPNDTLDINGVTYRIAEHPAAPGMPYGQEGRAGIVYCLEAHEQSSAETQGFTPRAALKVFKPRFRTPALVAQAERLAAYADLPGLAACRRAVLIPSRHAELLRRHPDLTYAVLMPWIEGPTWQEVLLEKRLLSPERALALAQGLANILAQLEQQGLAHCDLSAPNVILPALAQSAHPNTKSAIRDPQSVIEMVDLEGLYASGFTRPQEVSSGSLGYAHREAARGLWGPEADRFAGAVLLAEMLGWCDPQVVQAAWGESYFDPDEIQRDCDRYRRLVDSLRSHWGKETADMFERAWRSDALADCPTFGEWLVALPEGSAGKSPDRSTTQGPKEAKSPTQGPGEAKKHPDGEVPSDQPEPLKKGQSLEELRSQAYSLTTQGQWKEVLNICNMILSRWPDQGDIALLLFRARRLVDMDQEVEQAWLKALQSGQPADWEACWKAAQTILQQSPRTARYQEIAERAQQELEWAAIVARAEALVAENRWEEASRLLDAVPTDHTLAARVRAQLEVGRSRERRIAELLGRAEAQIQQEAWDDAIVTCQMGLALTSSTAAFHTLLERAYREREVERKVAEHRAAADRAAQAMDWEKAVVALEAAIALRPQRTELRARHEQFIRYRAWASLLAEARQLLGDYAWEEAQTKLAGIPDDFMQTAALREQVERERDRKAQLDAARAAYDGEAVLALLADVDKNYPQLAEWRAWARTEIERRRQLEAAEQIYDGERILALLADVDEDYPQLAEWRAWAEGEIERRHQLEAAKRAYDGEAVLALLADVGPDYPNLAEWQAWAENEIGRRHELEAAKQAYDGEAVLALLSDVGLDYPQLAEWRAWAEGEIARRHKLQAAKQAYDGEAVLALLADVAESYPQLAEWRAWAEREIERRRALQAAKQAYDGEAVLALLTDVDDSYPELIEWRAWAEIEITRRRALQAALQTYDGEQVLAILADAPTDYPRLIAWRAWANAEIERRHALQTARQAYDGEQVLALLADVDESYPQLAEWQAWAQHEIDRKQRLAAARQAYEGETVLTLLADVDQMYPQLAEWLAWAQQEVTRRQNLQDARLAYDGEKVLALLEDVPADYPHLAEWRAWAQREIDRKQQLAAARRAYDGEAALALLADVDEHYPQLAEWRTWAQTWAERRHLLTEARRGQRWQDVLQLLQEMPPDYPDRERLLQETRHLLWQQKHLEQVQAEFAAGRWEEVITRCDQIIAEGGDPALFDPLREQAREEQMTDREISQLADETEERVRAGAWGEAVALLEQALALRPARQDLSARLAEVHRAWERERAIERAQEAYAQEQWDDVLALLEGWTAEDTRAAELYQNARNKLIADLYEQAEADERNSRWEAALTGLQRLQILSVADEALPMRIERVRHEHQAALALDRSRQARARGRWKEVLTEANHALTLFPDRAEALALRQEAEQALALQRKQRLVLAVSLGGILIVLLFYSALRHMIPDADIKSTVTAQAEAVATMASTAFENVAAADSLTATTQVEATATARAMAIKYAIAADSSAATAQAEATATARTVAIRHTAAADSLTVVARARLTDQAGRAVATAPRPSLTDTPTPRPTRTPTLRPTNTPTPRPTNTFTPRPTNTPTRLSAPVLLSPEDNASVSGQATFVWLWDGPALAANQAFELRIWKDGQPDHYGAAEPTRQTTITIWLGGATGVQQGGPGSYYWTVAVVETNPYRRVGPEAPPRRLQVGGDSGSNPPPRPTWTPPTP